MLSRLIVREPTFTLLELFTDLAAHVSCHELAFRPEGAALPHGRIVMVSLPRAEKPTPLSLEEATFCLSLLVSV